MVFESWEAGQLPIEPTGFPLADSQQLVRDIPALSRAITLAMPCVGLDAWSSDMASIRWPGPYIVKYALDIDPEVAKQLFKLQRPPLPGAVLKIGAAGNILE
jgi:uroporphyrinogen-III decarboxylase